MPTSWHRNESLASIFQIRMNYYRIGGIRVATITASTDRAHRLADR